jgi:hypothetical protein
MADHFRAHLLVVLGVLVLVVFGSGILVGLNVGKTETTTVERFIKDSELNSESYVIEQALFESFSNSSCSFTRQRLDEMSVELGSIGTVLADANAEETLGSASYNVLKRKYHLMQMRTYLLFYTYDRQCSPEATVILYYYSKNDTSSGSQGEVLDRIVRDYQAKVFAIEYNYSAELNFLEQYYNISSTPSLVVDYNATLEGFHDYPDLSVRLNHAS